MEVIQLHEAMVFLGRFPALAGVNLAVHTGEIIALQGANGAGKTTLLKLCAGLIPLDKGSGKVLGHDLDSEQKSIRRSVAMLGHTSGLYEDLTVDENILFWAQAAGLDRAAAYDRRDDAIQRMGIEERLRRLPVSRLSAGQKRRKNPCTCIRRRELPGRRSRLSTSAEAVSSTSCDCQIGLEPAWPKGWALGVGGMALGGACT